MNEDKTIQPGSPEFYDQLVKIASQQLFDCAKFKDPIIKRKKPQFELYNNKFPKRLRSLFQVPLPIMSGMIDTISASFDEPIEGKFEEQHPADYPVAQKVNSFWNTEKKSMDTNAKWDFKARLDRKNALFWGRGFLSYYAESDPKYKSHFNVHSFEEVFFQPAGGADLEKHLYTGVGNVIKTKEQLEKSELYDQTQVKKLIETAKGNDYATMLESALGYSEYLVRFKALGLDVESHMFVGQVTFNFVQWVMTYQGKRWYLLFDPITKIWIRGDEYKNIKKSGRYFLKSWSTHEDQKNFCNKSFSDDIYPIADSIITIFNQELTNREKSNYHTRYYDEETFPDVVKLDAANYRPDALVPFDSKGGTRSIQQSIYEPVIQQLAGSINLIEWMEQNSGRNIGVTELLQGGAQAASKKASAIFAEQQNLSKRFSYQSQSYTTCYAEILQDYLEELKEHMPEKLAIKLLGENGYEWDYLRRIDLNTEQELTVRIISSTQEQADSKVKSEKRTTALTALVQSPNINSKKRDEYLLRNGEFTDAQIKELMDTQNYGNKDIAARAEQVIIDILEGKEPKKYYGANTFFMQKLIDYATDHQETLGEKANTIFDYVMAHEQLVKDNMKRQAMKAKAGTVAPADVTGKEIAPSAPLQPNIPSATPTHSPAAIPAVVG